MDFYHARSKPRHQSRLLSAVVVIIEPKTRFSDHSHSNSFIKFNILPAIFISDTVGTCHSGDDAIIRAFEGQRSVIVVRIVC